MTSVRELHEIHGYTPFDPFENPTGEARLGLRRGKCMRCEPGLYADEAAKANAAGLTAIPFDYCQWCRKEVLDAQFDEHVKAQREAASV